jgi:hypothetical protein
VRTADIPAWWTSGTTPVDDAGTTLRPCDSTIALLITRAG